MPAASVRLVSLVFRHADRAPVLDDVSLDLSPGLAGLVGENGAGKSTLLRLIAGELAPLSGSVRVEPPDARVVLCRQEVDEPDARVIALADRTDGTARRWLGVLSADAAVIDRWSTLSPGERRRLQLAAALADDPDVLLLDEPTNHVDARARGEIARALLRFRGVGILVSHDRALLDEVAPATIRLARGRLCHLALPYSAAREVWAAERDRAIAERAEVAATVRTLERRLADTRRAHASADRGRHVRIENVRDHDARSMARKYRAETAEARVGRLVSVRRAEAERAREKLAAHAIEKDVGADVTAGFVASRRAVIASIAGETLVRGDRAILRDVHAVVRRDTRVRIVGANGAGKSTLVAALVASVPPGEPILHLEQELAPSASRRLLDDVRALGRDVRGRVLAIVAALGVDPDRLLASASPSPGEGRKLALADAIGRGAVALFLDEPTNHLDLPSVERLEAALLRWPGALVVVTHDPVFARGATKETWTVGGGQVRPG